MFRFGNVTWRDIAKQQDQIEELETQLRSERRRRSQMRSQFSELQRARGTLEERLDRLSTAFEAFVELSEIRTELAMYPDTSVLRSQTLRLLDGEQVSDVYDMAGYWLPPAVWGLGTALDDDQEATRRHLTKASERDPLRSGVFILLAAAQLRCTHTPELAEWILPRILPELPPAVTRYQRALWLLAVDGHLGVTAPMLLLDRVRSALNTSRTTASAAEAAADPEVDSLKSWAGVLGSGRTSDLRPAWGTRIPDQEALADRATASASLHRLRNWLQRELPPPPAEPDPLVEETLRELVSEGHEPQIPLLARATELQEAVQAGGTEVSSPTTWTDAAGDVQELLQADGTASDGPSNRRNFAVAADAETLLAEAQNMAERAQRDARDEAVLTFQGTRLQVTSQGYVATELAAAARDSTAAGTRWEPGTGTLMSALAAGGALLAFVLLVSGSEGLWVWAIVILTAWAGLYAYRRAAVTQNSAIRAYAEEHIRSRAEATVRQLEEVQLEHRQHVADVPTDLATIRALLADYVSATGRGAP